MSTNKELCPKCLGAKEVLSLKRKRDSLFKAKPCGRCELDKNGKPSGLITEETEEFLPNHLIGI